MDIFSFQNDLKACVALGFVTTNMAFVASYPFDTVSRRMMMTCGEAYKYKSAIDAASQILKNEGFKSFYKGLGAHYLHVVVASVAVVSNKRLQDSIFGKSSESSDSRSDVSI